MNPARNEKGMVLLLVLVVVTLLSALLVEFSFSTLVDLRLTETFRDSTRAWYLAKGGIRAGQIILSAPLDTAGYDHPSEPWGQGVPAFPVKENGMVSISIEDLGGKLNVNDLLATGGNINTDMREVLERLFGNLAIDHPAAFPDPPADMAAALFDWMDTDDIVYQQTGTGAEDAFYQGLPSPYPAKDAPLDTLDELQMIRGFTTEGYRLLAPFLTVHGTKVLNINTAPPEVLMAFHPDVDQTAADQIVQFRETQSFQKLSDLAQLLGQGSLAYSGLASHRSITSGVKSDRFLITSQGAIGDDGGSRTASAIVDHSGKVYYLKVE